MASSGGDSLSIWRDGKREDHVKPMLQAPRKLLACGQIPKAQIFTTGNDEFASGASGRESA
jgi:hypothetical protein